MSISSSLMGTINWHLLFMSFILPLSEVSNFLPKRKRPFERTYVLVTVNFHTQISSTLVTSITRELK